LTSRRDTDPLNFEKRAPFPTITIFRAGQLKRGISDDKTAVAADLMKTNLKTVGYEILCKELDRIIRLALVDAIVED